MLKSLAFFLFLLMSCDKGINLDPSMDALASGDFTLLQSACSTGLAQGLDVCRVVEGAPISEVWQFVIPKDRLKAGEIKIRYKQRVFVKAVSADSNIVSIPWRDVIGADTWTLDMDAPVQAVGTIKYDSGTGDRMVDVLGLTYLIVLKKGYSPMPIDSGFEGWKTDCKIAYSTSGRSSLECQ